MMNSQKKILIVGGYGHVGRRIAAELARAYPGLVLIAGRDIQKAGILAEQIGNDIQPLWLDVDKPAAIDAALEEVGMVVNCIDLPELHLLHAAINHGLAYVDVTARIAFWHAALALKTEARRYGARILLGAGLIPGIANVMARAAADRVGEVECVDTALLLSLGDTFGPAALDYMLVAASEPFVVVEDGRERVLRNFTGGQPVDFPLPIGRRTVYRFGLPEQLFYPQTLHVRGAATRLTLDPARVASFLAVLARTRVTSLIKLANIRRVLARVFGAIQNRYRGHKTYALSVEAQGARGLVRLGLVGENESNGTALGAAWMARPFYEGEISKPGVWLPEQVIAPAPFFEKLEKKGLLVQEY